MYELATVVLLGLAVFAVVNLIRHLGETTRVVRISLDLALGVLIAWVIDYSVFAGWDVTFRALWMGPAATGLVIGGVAAVWHEIVGLIAASARSPYGEAATIEAGMRDTKA